MANVTGVDRAHYADLFGGNLQRLLGGTANER